MKHTLLSLLVMAFCFPTVSNAAEDYFVRCPKSAKHQTDRKAIQRSRTLTFERQTLYVFVGKHVALADKVKSLLPDCGDVEVSMGGAGIECVGCKNPYSEIYEKYQSGKVGDNDLLRKMVEVNSGEEKTYLLDIIAQRENPNAPAAAPSAISR